MIRTVSVVTPALLFITSLSMQAQTAAPALIKTIPTTQALPQPTVGRSACNAEGTLYMRPFAARATQIDRIDINGTVLAPLIITQPQSRIRDFDLSGSRAAILVSDPNGSQAQVQTFSAEDTLLSTVKLAKPTEFSRFLPEKIAVFQSGRMIVLGDSSTPTDPTPVPFAGIFDAKGDYLGPLTETPAGTSTAKALVIGTGSSQDAAALPTRLLLTDGSLAYFVSDHHTLIKFDDTGKVVEALTLVSPEPGMVPTSASLTDGQILIEYTRPGTNSQAAFSIMSLYSLTSGTLIAKWNPADLSDGVLGCLVSKNVIEFVGTSKLERFQVQ